MSKRAQKYRYLPMLALGVVTMSLGGGALVLIRGFLNSAPPQQKKVVQEIQVIRPPPPPPDLPPPPPPPPDEKVDIAEPDQKPDTTPSNEPPPGEQLGLDAQGTAGGDAFGLVGRPGGHGLVGAGGSAFAWYAGLLKGEILSQLEDEKEAHRGSYSVLVKVWVRDDGSIERIRVAQSSGDRDRDRAIETALSRIGRISQAPPADMPQPINLRIVSKA